MAEVTLKAPEGALLVSFRLVNYAVEPDGTVTVPSFAVPNLLKAGCMAINGSDYTALDTRAEVDGAEGHHLSQFLNAHGVNDHYWEKNVHIHSRALREQVGDKAIVPEPHYGPVPFTLTVNVTDAGVVEFHSSSGEILHGSRIESKLVPPLTKVEHLMGPPDGKSGCVGRLKLPTGSTATSGVDEAATASVVIDGHHLADILDDLHGRVHEKGRGRMVLFTDDEKRAMALELHDKFHVKK